MAKKRREHYRRSHPLIKNRLLSIGVKYALRITAFLVILVGIGLAVKMAIISFAMDSSYFRIKNIRMVGERSDMLLEPIVKTLNSVNGRGIFAVDLKECASAIRDKYPQLKEIGVRRLLPDALEIRYKIRKPFCQVDSGSFYLVSEDGVILPNPIATADSNLPVVSGMHISNKYVSQDSRFYSKTLKKAISILKEVKDSNLSIEYKFVRLDIYEPRNPSLFLEDGTRIDLGEHSFKEKEKLLKEVLDDLGSKNKRARLIDLRFKDVVVEPAE